MTSAVWPTDKFLANLDGHIKAFWRETKFSRFVYWAVFMNGLLQSDPNVREYLRALDRLGKSNFILVTDGAMKTIREEIYLGVFFLYWCKSELGFLTRRRSQSDIEWLLRSEQAILDAVLHFLALQNELLESTGLVLSEEVCLLNQDFTVRGALTVKKNILHIGILCCDWFTVRRALRVQRFTGDCEQVKIVLVFIDGWMCARIKCGASFFEWQNVSRIDFFHFNKNWVAKFVFVAVKLTF